ncbi:gamma-glutamyltransferase [Horticoccus luteus]|uniref:Glutathione hydrolase proenzyme n=1 Tax=Horticoccus luteus TaxID=2862869 RepID=A0A8F9TUH6_9BACT|nr:gamma-glutamyltransferase [Horticoccus luteus]QYM78018.1 gamma-glutamyltransferase [Horticoccus luteus]
MPATRPPLLLAFFAALSLLVAPARAQLTAVEADHGMVVSVHALATQAGVEILQQGGNAVDASIATGLALVTVYPWAGNLGGGGFMLIHLATGRDVAIDFRETAPAAASHDMYLDAHGNVVKGLSTVGWRASGVPGTVAGFALALEKYGSGKVSWAQVCEPARRLAAEGHLITPYTADRFRWKRHLLEQFPESKRIYLHDGALWQAGELWRQPELAATFARLQKRGPREFYEGETAHHIADAMAANGGNITLADLQAYRAVERVPFRTMYRGYEVVTMPPPSSGSIALLQMLAMLEPFDVANLGAESSARYHLFVEVMRRAYRVRAEYLGDPDFVSIPVKALLDPSYTAALMSDFNEGKATPSADVKLPPLPGANFRPASPAAAPAPVVPPESTETTHFSVVDAAGNAVSTTYTLNGGYGSGVTIPGTGILMNNEMDDFTSKPGVPNSYHLIQGEANAIAPGKRPLSSMTPTIVLQDGKPFLVTGSPGGSTIITTVLQVITNVIDFKMPLGQAIEARRIHHQWMPDVINYEPYGMPTDVADALRARGHTLAQRNLYGAPGEKTPLSEFYQGDAESILVDPVTGHREGVNDPRKPDGLALGY